MNDGKTLGAMESSIAHLKKLICLLEGECYELRLLIEQRNRELARDVIDEGRR